MISLEFLSKSPTSSMMLMTFIGHMNCYSERSSRSMQARNSYNKNQTPENWKKITKLRNMKTKIKRESIFVYFLERCGGGPKSKDFWPTIKPFLSQKSTIKGDPNTILKEDEKLISDQNIVSEKMNDFFM